MTAEWIVNTFKMDVDKYWKPGIINSDQGSQFTSDEYIDFYHICSKFHHYYNERLDYSSIGNYSSIVVYQKAA